ncbi:hypothetical protein [Brevibacillus panacihumi]|uniref:hypothetical protein n=1 Tax=Brevibacillus panacihumi TaxID=497735 RepID=UPI001182B316|nr:hypothetical protein [Brevibacillus panacihumi]
MKKEYSEKDFAAIRAAQKEHLDSNLLSKQQNINLAPSRIEQTSLAGIREERTLFVERLELVEHSGEWLIHHV